MAGEAAAVARVCTRFGALGWATGGDRQSSGKDLLQLEVRQADSAAHRLLNPMSTPRRLHSPHEALHDMPVSGDAVTAPRCTAVIAVLNNQLRTASRARALAAFRCARCLTRVHGSGAAQVRSGSGGDVGDLGDYFALPLPYYSLVRSVSNGPKKAPKSLNPPSPRPTARKLACALLVHRGFR